MLTRTKFSLEVFGDRMPYRSTEFDESNTKQLEIMKKALMDAIETELTPRQRQMVTEYYFGGETVTSLAEKYNISKSTVSRHISRSRERLKSALKYGMYAIWSMNEDT